jgi:hypothetical protein
MIAYLNTKNTGPDAEVFRPEAYPAGRSHEDYSDRLGLITATVSRKTKSKL